MTIATSTEKNVTSSTEKYIPYRFFLRRNIGSASTHYTLTTTREGDVRQHGRFKFHGVGMSVLKRIFWVLRTKWSHYTNYVLSNLLM